MIQKALLLSTLAVGFLFANTAHAAIYKCVGADGNVTFKQTSCPIEDKVEKIHNSYSANKTQYDCRIANNFARTTTTQMRSGLSSDQLFSQYGGIDAIPRTSVGVINYIYSHIGNVDTHEQRIVALSAARCSTGSYGPVNCEDFPYAFVAELGGCEAATKSMVNHAANAAAHAVTPTTEQAVIQTPNMAARSADAIGLESKECNSDVQAQLTALFSQMKSNQSSDISRSKYDTQKEELARQMNDC